MEKRNRHAHFRATEEEMERIHQKMDEMGIHSLAAYLRKMALDGYCVKLDLQDVKEMVSLLRHTSNNLNQYAKRANETGSVYEEDIRDLQERLDEIWECAREILSRLASIR
ncbi:MAG: MobC family plasmid mobilization relaxosome protein [Lachnospiraceae bacterium]|nr:MobC family plasmid mobilization relaxosome protein [Lachnospiraceae bacterium]